MTECDACGMPLDEALAIVVTISTESNTVPHAPLCAVCYDTVMKVANVLDITVTLDPGADGLQVN